MVLINGLAHAPSAVYKVVEYQGQRDTGALDSQPDRKQHTHQSDLKEMSSSAASTDDQQTAGLLWMDGQIQWECRLCLGLIWKSGEDIRS